MSSGRHGDAASGEGIVDDVGTQLAESSQRFTATRKAIVSALATAGGPLSIPEILGATDDLAQSSVYRNLAVLEEAGVVVRVAGVDERARYELSEHLTGHHHHLVCTSCGAVSDVRIPDAAERELDRVLSTIAAGAGFEIEHHRLDLVGRCGECR